MGHHAGKQDVGETELQSGGKTGSLGKTSDLTWPFTVSACSLLIAKAALRGSVEEIIQPNRPASKVCYDGNSYSSFHWKRG